MEGGRAENVRDNSSRELSSKSVPPHSMEVPAQTNSSVHATLSRCASTPPYLPPFSYSPFFITRSDNLPSPSSAFLPHPPLPPPPSPPSPPSHPPLQLERVKSEARECEEAVKEREEAALRRQRSAEEQAARLARQLEIKVGGEESGWDCVQCSDPGHEGTGTGKQDLNF